MYVQRNKNVWAISLINNSQKLFRLTLEMRKHRHFALFSFGPIQKKADNYFIIW